MITKIECSGQAQPSTYEVGKYGVEGIEEIKFSWGFIYIVHCKNAGNVAAFDVIRVYDDECHKENK